MSVRPWCVGGKIKIHLRILYLGQRRVQSATNDRFYPHYWLILIDKYPVKSDGWRHLDIFDNFNNNEACTFCLFEYVS